MTVRMMQKAARAAAVSGMVLASIAMSSAAYAVDAAPPAAASAKLAAAGCPGDGHISRNYTCTSLSGGALFHQKYTNDKAATWYVKTSGSKISGKLGFTKSGKQQWGSHFSQSSGTTKRNTWSGVTYCSSTVGLLSVDGQQTYQTPLTTCNS
ncbi:hypothetical protein [Streptomyces sp. NPDC014733]|uniref:hypothetical protein n=1 Tax=Streptomyces sp. NPDC014733 TaxID=3364885 RepID=UPI0036FCD209